MCINRIRLEFKDHSCDAIRYFVKVLIESDWNLKKMVASLRIIALSVLIESDWNLKYIYGFRRRYRQLPVLIESDWNLKFTLRPLYSPTQSRINRIRLEFKEAPSRTNARRRRSINRIRLEFKDDGLELLCHRL